MTPLTEPPARDRLARPVPLPPHSPWLLRAFRWYARRYLCRHFHALRLSRSGYPFPPPGRDPLLIVLNHPSWWDPLVGLVLSGLLADRDQFAAIDAAAVRRYAFFTRLGFVGVETGSVRGAAEFVRTGVTILSQPGRVFWVTAQGRFADVRERPLAIHSGVGYLAARLSTGLVLPLALEYTFWTERTPEALVRAGEPLRITDYPGSSGKDWTRRIEEALTHNLDVLNRETISRDPERFTVLLAGRAGVGGPYDWWHRLRAWLRGEAFDPAHEAVMRRSSAERGQP